MNKARAVMFVCFLVVFAAGVAGGIFLAPGGRERGRGSLLSRELNLGSGQREQIRRIWSEVMGEGKKRLRDQSEEVRSKRQAAVEALLKEDQVEVYKRIMATEKQDLDAVKSEREKLFVQAVERTKAVLDEEQKARYEQLMEEGRKGLHHRFPGKEPAGRGKDEGSAVTDPTAPDDR
ncbi:MAG: hypothetical protein J7M19_07865 [Planctomycetes bacterium]|nr:hypothetical protein [Planctomycetota bacterium]